MKFNSLPEAHFALNYNKLKQKHDEAVRTNKIPSEPLMKQDPPTLDLKVRILFEENLASMIFPKVKELLFRVSKSSPIEIAAKVLARKNEHHKKWKDYSFSLINANESFAELRIDDLSISFDIILSKISGGKPIE